VREYRLQLNYTFRVVNQGKGTGPPNEISLSATSPFDDSNVLAKDLEEGLLWRDMNNDLVNQIMRRLSIIKPKNPDLEEDE
jgi:LPS-assembly lipoprotein